MTIFGRQPLVCTKEDQIFSIPKSMVGFFLSTHQLISKSFIICTPSPQPVILPWLKILPLAPQYHPTLKEFQDPISFILKIEQEASHFGICKIVPPLPPASKKTTLLNLNLSFSSHSQPLVSSPNNSISRNFPTFTTRGQQIGFCPRHPRPAQKPIWQSGESYSLSEFEEKSRQFENAQLKKFGKKGKNSGFSPLQVETLFWKAEADKPFSVEYANDMPGSGFSPLKEESSEIERPREKDWENVGDTPWNMRVVPRTKGSLLKFMKDDIPGVTTPMVYVGMMFSWFAWHVEDHELHSLNYSHLGAGKVWYGIPRDARLAFEEVVRVQGYGGEVNPLTTLFILSGKTTILSPEILVAAGVPCCRLVQNPGEFVVTFPGAYHSGFSLGFNCGEAANIATPEWLKVAKEAAIRRASINHPPMISHFQLLYKLAISLCSRMVEKNGSEPRSSRLKGKSKGGENVIVKEQFVKNVIQTNNFLGSITLDDKLSCVLLPRDKYDASLGPNSSSIGSQVKFQTECSFPSSKFTERNHSFNGNISGKTVYSHFNLESRYLNGEKKRLRKCGGSLDQKLFSSVACGILSFACVAIVWPTEATAMHLMTYGPSSFSDESSDKDKISNANQSSYDDLVASGNLTVSMINDEKSTYSGKHQAQYPSQIEESVSEGRLKKEGVSALSLIASAYGDYSDDDNPFPYKIVKKDENKGHLQDEVPKDMEFSLGKAKQYQGQSGLHLDHSSLFLTKKPDKDSSRIHVFCLEHALEVQKKLRLIGGACLLLVCHPDYPKIEAEAKPVAEELGVDNAWKNINFKEASSQDEEIIRSALEDKGAVPLNSDWSVMMGFNLWFSANISKSFLYSKQMPYNVVIYKVFGHDSSGISPGKPKKIVSGKQKKKAVVSGKWCGKVWMSNKVHPYLAYVNENFDGEEDGFVKNLRLVEGTCRRKILTDFANHAVTNEVPTLTSSHLEMDMGSKSAIRSKKPSVRKNIKKPSVRKNIKKPAIRKNIKKPNYSQPENCNTIIYHDDSDDSQRVLADFAKHVEADKVTSPTSSHLEMETVNRSVIRRNKPSEKKNIKKKKYSQPANRDTMINDDDEDDFQRVPLDLVNHVEAKKVRTPASRNLGVGTEVANKSSIKRKKPLKKKNTKKPKCSQPENCDAIVDGDDLVDSSRVLSSRSVKTLPSSSPPNCNYDDMMVRAVGLDLEVDGVGSDGCPMPPPKNESGRHEITEMRENQKEEMMVKQEYLCDMKGCTMSFNFEHELAMHKNNQCPVEGCGKKLLCHKYMKKHHRVHLDIRPLKCPWKGCKKTFKWKWSLTEHIRVHTGERPYVCLVPHCFKTFRFVSDFSRHKLKTGHMFS